MFRALVVALALAGLIGTAALAPAPAHLSLSKAGGRSKVAAGGGGGGIAFQASSGTYVGNNGGTGNFSGNMTVAAGSNLLLVACVVGTASANADSITGVTYNGTAMTLGVKRADTTSGASRWLYEYYKLAPSTGTHALAVTQTGGDFLIVTAAVYTGVGQTLEPDNSGSTDSGNTAVTSLNVPITINTANSWVVACGQAQGDMSGQSGTNTTNRAFDSAFNNLNMVDSNGPIAAGSFNANITVGAAQAVTGVAVSYHP